ncbi:MAG: hypothetical protein FIA97_14020 [Methylococcaceae bacterium]|nr:hypothetical protein [Methylococcaceae bacterium]
MKRLAVCSLVGVSLAMTGCAVQWPPKPPTVAPHPDSHYHQADLSHLVDYGGKAAAMDDGARRAECQHLQELATTNPSLGLKLHLATLQSVGDACGSVEKALDSLRRVKAEVRDESMRSWVAYQEEVLGRLDREADFRREIEQKVKQATEKALRSQREAKTKENQVKTLQDKLDALKSIEQGHDPANPQGAE